ncbi:carbon-nitrogen hydrolase family protein [Anaerobacillus sp. MEB173]|uniref:carbon-nitrogen hydrolase family protein n=1 Tax=Anaerobacillus sp. MEB173 TaxID=3383345 RepID=UPI003F92A614
MKQIKISLLHLLPIAGNIPYNQKLIEKAVTQASANKADWIITPELAVSGLQFSHLIGTDWINEQPDDWLKHFCKLVDAVNATVFLGCAERSIDNHLYNTVFVINQNGEIIGKQRKLSRVDNWSTSGKEIMPIEISNVKVGVLVCADSYNPKIAHSLLDQGAKFLVAPSSWGPGLHGPTGEWEQRSKETGLPLIVCNRTGEDKTVTFWEAESLVINNGQRLLSHKSSRSAILSFEWDMEKMELLSNEFEVEYL